MNETRNLVGRLVCSIEREIAKEEIDNGLRAGVNMLRGITMRMNDDERYHNTKYLLKQFRRVAYSVRVSEAELNMIMEMEHGVKLSTLETNADLAGIDLSGTKMERYAQSIIRSRKMLEIIKHALKILRGAPDEGELYYQILYETYCSPSKPKNRDEVISGLDMKGFIMSPSTYYVYLKRAVYEFDTVLWGYTSRDGLEIIKEFIPETE